MEYNIIDAFCQLSALNTNKIEQIVVLKQSSAVKYLWNKLQTGKKDHIIILKGK